MNGVKAKKQKDDPFPLKNIVNLEEREMKPKEVKLQDKLKKNNNRLIRFN
jgi:hypothetical protein